jgi:uncharacterized protein
VTPSFPEFAPLTLAHRPALEGFLQAHPPRASEYTFTNLYAWRRAAGYKVAQFGDGFLILRAKKDRVTFLEPLVATGQVAALTACLDYLAAQGAPAVVERVGEDFLAALGADAVRFTVTPDPDQYDYVYDTEALTTLNGPKYHAKKNLLNQFHRKYDARYFPLTHDLLPDAERFAREWCAQRNCDDDEGLEQESGAVQEMLAHGAHLSAVGGVFLIDDAIVSLTLGEPLNTDTFVIHVEKAKLGFTGIYQAMNCEFLRHCACDFPFVNREQDMGIPGLRRAKESYHPVHMVQKYRVEGQK